MKQGGLVANTSQAPQTTTLQHSPGLSKTSRLEGEQKWYTLVQQVLDRPRKNGPDQKPKNTQAVPREGPEVTGLGEHLRRLHRPLKGMILPSTTCDSKFILCLQKRLNSGEAGGGQIDY